MEHKPANTTVGRALALAYGSIAILVQELLDGVEDAEKRPIDDPLMQAVHELREVDLPEMSQWVSGLLVRVPGVDGDTPSGQYARINHAIGVLGEVYRDVLAYRESLADDYEEVPFELDDLLNTLRDDIERLDVVDLP